MTTQKYRKGLLENELHDLLDAQELKVKKSLTTLEKIINEYLKKSNL